MWEHLKQPATAGLGVVVRSSPLAGCRLRSCSVMSYEKLNKPCAGLPRTCICCSGRELCAGFLRLGAVIDRCKSDCEYCATRWCSRFCLRLAPRVARPHAVVPVDSYSLPFCPTAAFFGNAHSVVSERLRSVSRPRRFNRHGPTAAGCGFAASVGGPVIFRYVPQCEPPVVPETFAHPAEH